MCEKKYELSWSGKDLKAAFKAIKPFMSTTGALPVLGQVRARLIENTLWLEATDTYVLGMVALRSSTFRADQPTQPWYISYEEVNYFLKAVRVGQRYTLVADDEGLSILSEGEGVLRSTHLPNRMPALSYLLLKERTAPGDEATKFTAKNLLKVTTAANALGEDSALTMESAGDMGKKPVRFRVESDKHPILLFGAIMPRRVDQVPDFTQVMQEVELNKDTLNQK